MHYLHTLQRVSQRIQRGYRRSTTQVSISLRTDVFPHILRARRATFLLVLTLRTALPVQMVQAAGPAISAVPEEPSSMVPLIAAGQLNQEVQVSLAVDPQASFTSTVVAPQLGQVTVGKSNATVTAEEQARVAATKQQYTAVTRGATPMPEKNVSGDTTAYDALFQKYFGADWKIIKAVVKLESGFNPNAVSPTHDYGLAQINRVHARKVGGDLSRLFDPETNIRVASDIWKASGFWPWSTYKKQTARVLQIAQHY